EARHFGALKSEGPVSWEEEIERPVHRVGPDADNAGATGRRRALSMKRSSPPRSTNRSVPTCLLDSSPRRTQRLTADSGTCRRTATSAWESHWPVSAPAEADAPSNASG